MAQTLESYHFNPRKAGQIFRQLCKERGISQASLAAQTGTSYDTVGNVFAGKVQDIPFERVFKFCCVLRIPIESYMMLMLKDEDIDFTDRVLLYDSHEDEIIPASDIDPAQATAPVPDTVVAVAEAAAAADPPHADSLPAAIPPCTGYSRDDVSLLLDRIERQHLRHTEDLRANQAIMHELVKTLVSTLHRPDKE